MHYRMHRGVCAFASCAHLTIVRAHVPVHVNAGRECVVTHAPGGEPLESGFAAGAARPARNGRKMAFFFLLLLRFFFFFLFLSLLVSPRLGSDRRDIETRTSFSLSLFLFDGGTFRRIFSASRPPRVPSPFEGLKLPAKKATPNESHANFCPLIFQLFSYSARKFSFINAVDRNRALYIIIIVEEEEVHVVGQIEKRDEMCICVSLSCFSRSFS